MILYWVAILALTTILYVLLDGFDLGVGILFGFTRNEDDRRRMLSSISPVWDGNETWLVLAGTVLFGAFPRAYATLLSAFYLPIILMLGALILRGVAFEFRYKARTMRWLWDLGFSLGSVVATFVQGLTVGALARGIPMQDGHYAGGTFGWLSPFACLTGIGLCLGYALLGAGWLVAKCEGSLRQRGYRLLPGLTVSVFGFLAIAFIYALVAHFQIMDRWLERPILLIFPAIGAFASIQLVRCIQYHQDFQPILMTALIFVSAFGTLAVSFWPYMIPFSVTIEQAAAPASSLRFMFWGAGLLVLPLILTYTVTVYRVFRGKIVEELHYH
jgi:cytochrome bd ubiquinol oxidase subunit II